MIVFVKNVRKLMITLFGYIHPIKMLYLLDTLMCSMSRYLKEKRSYGLKHG